MDYSGLKKPEEYGDGLGTGMGRALTPNEVHGNFLWAGNLIANIFKVGDVISSFASSRDGFLLMDGKTIGNSVSGAALADDKYEDLFNLLKNFPDYGNTGSEDFDSGDTVYLPDQAAQFLRGAINGEIEAADWKTTANRTVDLGRSNIPNGTPFRIDAVPAGLSGLFANTTYYLALYSGTEYNIYDTESHANANDETTGKIAISGTVTESCNYTSVGGTQGKAMWFHVHPSINTGSDLHLVGSILGDVDFGTEVGKTFNPGDVTNYLAVTDTPISDLVHDTPEGADEPRGPLHLINFFIKY